MKWADKKSYKNICSYWWSEFTHVYTVLIWLWGQNNWYILTLDLNLYFINGIYAICGKVRLVMSFNFMTWIKTIYLIQSYYKVFNSPTGVLACWNIYISISELDFVIWVADDLTASSLKNIAYVASNTIKQIDDITTSESLYNNIRCTKVVDSINSTRRSSYQSQINRV